MNYLLYLNTSNITLWDSGSFLNPMEKCWYFALNPIRFRPHVLISFLWSVFSTYVVVFNTFAVIFTSVFYVCHLVVSLGPGQLPISYSILKVCRTLFMIRSIHVQQKWVQEFINGFMGLLSQPLYVHYLFITYWFPRTPFSVPQKSWALVTHPDTNFPWLYLHSESNSRRTKKEKTLNVLILQCLKFLWAPAVTTVPTTRSFSLSWSWTLN